ncbi:MAG: glycosyltransferase [Bacteroidales bacterium]|nr:glycosyltransferase [Bacteroidales bacterium]MCF8350615.1 glycosyltransferase [Bacteroidales bacterium]MCF8377152.1 glycosyltransferase [Bacteroidales bacterium]
MKILYLVHQFYPMHGSGTEKSTLTVASNIQKNGNNVKVLSFSFYEPEEYDQKFGSVLYRRNFVGEIEVIDYRLEETPHNMNDLFVDVKGEMESFAEFILRQESPHLVHVMHTMRTGIFVKVLLKLKIPYILTLTDFYQVCPKIVLRNSDGKLCKGPENGQECFQACPELSQSYISKRLNIAKEIIYNARFNVVCSKFVQDIYKKEFPDMDFLLIRHGISFNTVKRNLKKYDKSDKLKFLFTGTISEMKGVETLLDAFEQVPEAQLYLYGKAATDEYFEEFTARISRLPNVEYLGMFEKDKMGEVVSVHDIMVVSSNSYETYSRVLHEALSCYVPVICSDVPALNEKIVNDLNGYIYEMGNSGELAEILKKVTGNPEILNRLKENISKEPLMILEQEVYVYEKLYNMCL